MLQYSPCLQPHSEAVLLAWNQWEAEEEAAGEQEAEEQEAGKQEALFLVSLHGSSEGLMGEA